VITDIEQACDRLLVLGGGRKLLDLSIAQSLAEHRVVEVATTADDVVGTFMDTTGESVSLTRTGSGAPARGRPATLEEVVLGHLAAGRDRPVLRTVAA
jgi:hypothetical protein